VDPLVLERGLGAVVRHVPGHVHHVLGNVRVDVLARLVHFGARITGLAQLFQLLLLPVLFARLLLGAVAFLAPRQYGWRLGKVLL